MPLFGESNEEGFFVVRTDPGELLGSYSPHSFLLDGQLWPSVEHYYQAMKYPQGEYFTRIFQAADPATAHKLGEARFKLRLKDWKDNRIVFMARGLYAKCKIYPQVEECLLETGDQKIIERSLYDYFWGLGRDGRGTNNYGKVLMRVRQKLREELSDPNT